MAGFLLRQFMGPSNSENGPTWIVKAQGTIYRGGLIAVTGTTLVWTSIFLYAFFHHTYMPPISHTKAVHFQFRACSSRSARCNFPSANVTLTNKESFLMFGQPYKISVELDVPDSQRNRDVGMFMICVNLKSRENYMVGKSCRPTILKYKSYWVGILHTLFNAPFFLLGSTEERQHLSVELFSNYLDDQNYRTTRAFVQIQSREIDVYSASLQINAHFTGIRYIMFNYPYLSAAFGFVTNLFFLSVIGFLSWYKFYSPAQLTLHVGYDKGDSDSFEDDISRSDDQRSSKSFEKVKMSKFGKSASIDPDDYDHEPSKEDLGEVQDQDFEDVMNSED